LGALFGSGLKMEIFIVVGIVCLAIVKAVAMGLHVLQDELNPGSPLTGLENALKDED
jgi:hypothetical protein